MTTIKFKRPDGEARLAVDHVVKRDFQFFWQEARGYPDGGYVRIVCNSTEGGADPVWHYHGKPEEIHLEHYCSDPAPILLAAESLRNQRRALAGDGSEWRNCHGEGIRFSAPTLTGLRWRCFGESSWNTHFLNSLPMSVGARDAALKWHRATYKPADDECYPKGELPRKLAEDEVRFPDGSAGRMRTVPGGLLLTCGDKSWSGTVDQLSTELNLFDPSQLARLQSFWDKNQKQARPTCKNSFCGASLSNGVCPYCSTSPDYAVRTEALAEAGMVRDDDGNTYTMEWHEEHDDERRLVAWACKDGAVVTDLATLKERYIKDPSQRATVEAFFAKGPPVELAEEVFLIGDSKRWARINGDGLFVDFDSVLGPKKNTYRVSRTELEQLAKDDSNPLGWPRALAYFDRHVAKPEPARVTDVRFNGSTLEVFYRRVGRRFVFNGDWYPERKAELHPLDIALIERCWAEGRLGEREVLFDSGVVGTVEPHDARYAIRTGPASVCLLSFNFETNDGDAAWRWSGDHTIHDPAQRARVRAIVAGMQSEAAIKRHVEAFAPTAKDIEDSMAAKAAAVTPSGEVKAPTTNDLINRCIRLLEAVEPAPDLTELREAWKDGRASVIGRAVERLVGK